MEYNNLNKISSDVILQVIQNKKYIKRNYVNVREILSLIYLQRVMNVYIELLGSGC